jgi:hypothetical protein
MRSDGKSRPTAAIPRPTKTLHIEWDFYLTSWPLVVRHRGSIADASGAVAVRQSSNAHIARAPAATDLEWPIHKRGSLHALSRHAMRDTGIKNQTCFHIPTLGARQGL